MTIFKTLLTPENQKFSDTFKGYETGALAKYG